MGKSKSFRYRKDKRFPPTQFNVPRNSHKCMYFWFSPIFFLFFSLYSSCYVCLLGTGAPWGTLWRAWSTQLPPSAPSSSSLCSLSLSRRYLACSFLGPNSTQTKRGARLTRSTSPASRSFRFGGFWIQRDSVASLGLVCHLFSGCIAGLRLCMWLHITSLLIRLTVTFTFSFQVNG